MTKIYSCLLFNCEPCFISFNMIFNRMSVGLGLTGEQNKVQVGHFVQEGLL